MQRVAFSVLGPVTAENDTGPLALKGPRHRAVLARLIVARRRVVPVARLVADLWDEPSPGAVGAVQTFVAALRKALEPERPPRTPARLLVTEGPGYRLRAEPDAVDAWRFEAAVGAAAKLPPADALRQLDEALGLWRGPAYAEFAGEDWARGERSRLSELRAQAVERQAGARLDLGLAAEAVPGLEEHLADHPWREDAWRLLALALYRTSRQGDALAVLRRARTALAERLGLDPGADLRRLEADILAQDPTLDLARPQPQQAPQPTPQQAPQPRPHPAHDPAHDPGHDPAHGSTQESVTSPPAGSPPLADSTSSAPTEPPAPAPAPAAPTSTAEASAAAADRLWTRAAESYDRTVAAGARARLESTVGLIRNLAVTGGSGLEAAREHRVAAIAAAERTGDAELTAQVIGTFDVPAIWTRCDDPEQARQVVAAAERTLAALPDGRHDTARCRLLATIALEMRGTRSPRGPGAAREAEGIARRLDDPALLAFALNGVFMQSCTRAGLAPRRDAIGAELVALSARHGLVTYEVLGHLIRLQARGALADFAGADAHARAADRLAERHERPLVAVFIRWYGALRSAATGQPHRAEAAYRAATDALDGAGMPGLGDGLPQFARLCLLLSAGTRSEPAYTPDSVRGEAPLLAPSPAPHSPHSPPTDSTGRPTSPVLSAARTVDRNAEWGPYRDWAEPFALLREGRRAEAGAALRTLPEPPADLMYEALCCLEAALALELGDRAVLERVHARLLPASGQLAGAGSGLVTVGPVDRWLTEIDTALRVPD